MRNICPEREAKAYDRSGGRSFRSADEIDTKISIPNERRSNSSIKANYGASSRLAISGKSDETANFAERKISSIQQSQTERKKLLIHSQIDQFLWKLGSKNAFLSFFLVNEEI